MHMQGEPATMMDNPVYENVVDEVSSYLSERIDVCVAAGIDKARIAIDPGFGFGKTRDHNLELIDNLDQLIALECPILVGLSRKFGKHKKPKERLPESLAVAVKSVLNGAEIVRVHDVAETRDALAALRLEGA
jgi:dihydropteroate synthase